MYSFKHLVDIFQIYSMKNEIENISNNGLFSFLKIINFKKTEERTNGPVNAQMRSGQLFLH